MKKFYVKFSPFSRFVWMCALNTLLVFVCLGFNVFSSFVTDPYNQSDSVFS